MEKLIFVGRRNFEQAVDDLVGSYSVALGGEVHHEPMSQHGFCQCAHILDRYMRAAVNERPRLSAEDEKLRSARTGTPSFFSQSFWPLLGSSATTVPKPVAA